MTYTGDNMQSDEPGGQPRTLSGPVNSSTKEDGPPQQDVTHAADSRFVPAGRGVWSHVPDHEWNDWRWQLRNRITSLEQLEKLMLLTNEERLGVQLAGHHLALAITPYFFNLIDVNDPHCPIRRQVVPRVEETIHGAVGDDRSVRRRRAHGGAGTGASVSRPRVVSGDGPVRGVLPVLHSEPRGQRSGGATSSYRFQRSDQLHPRAQGSARRVVERRRSVVVQR